MGGGVCKHENVVPRSCANCDTDLTEPTNLQLKQQAAQDRKALLETSKGYAEVCSENLALRRQIVSLGGVLDYSRMEETEFVIRQELDQLRKDYLALRSHYDDCVWSCQRLGGEVSILEDALFDEPGLQDCGELIECVNVLLQIKRDVEGDRRLEL